jgi:hypothetical protein
LGNGKLVAPPLETAEVAEIFGQDNPSTLRQSSVQASSGQAGFTCWPQRGTKKVKKLLLFGGLCGSLAFVVRYSRGKDNLVKF